MRAKDYNGHVPPVRKRQVRVGLYLYPNEYAQLRIYAQRFGYGDNEALRHLIDETRLCRCADVERIPA